jgi:hypothetical protein
MKFGHLQGTGRKWNPPASVATTLSRSLESVEVNVCGSNEQFRMEAVRATTVAARVRLNSV